MGTDNVGIQFLPDVTSVEGPAGRRVTVSYFNGSGADIPDGSTVEITAEATHGIGHSIAIGQALVDEAAVFGVADETIVDQEIGRVLVWGVKEDVPANADVTALDGVQQDGAAAGQVELAAAIVDRRLGLALTATAGGTATIFVGI